MSDIQQRLFNVVSEQLGVEVDKITPASRFIEDLGADSLDTVELIMAIEEQLDIEIQDSEAEKFFTVQDVLDYIANHVAA
ncbi:MAG: acyl carrier protein [Oceanospirillaceae bacterium]|nr:acyl carrier protein [Oceanospirillaceae bacterium]